MLPDRLRQFVAEHTAELPGIGEEVEQHLRNVMTMREEQARFAKRPKLLKPAEEPFWNELRAEVELGVDPRTAAEVMRHSVAVMLNVYVRSNENLKRDALSKLFPDNPPSKPTLKDLA